MSDILATRPELPQLAFFAAAILFCFWARNRALNRVTAPPSMRVRRPGWIARRRARGGIKHQRDRVGVGYTSATRSVSLTARELAGHGFVVGGPGSGKTTFLQLLIEATAGRMPVVIVDPKGSPALEATVREHGGIVWTLDGKVPADLLDPRPWQVPDLLLEAEDYSADARAYRDAAHQRGVVGGLGARSAGRADGFGPTTAPARPYRASQGIGAVPVAGHQSPGLARAT